jgi:formamidase
LTYLASEKIPRPENLSKDISSAAKKALLEMIDYISQTYRYIREKACLIALIAVDLRIGQLVDVPNASVTVKFFRRISL